MLEWRKIKHDLIRYHKMKKLFKKLKEKDYKEYKEEILKDIEKKRLIIKGWILNNVKRKSRRKSEENL